MMQQMSSMRLVTLLGFWLVVGALASIGIRSGTEASSVQQSPVLRIDAQAAGNTANALGSIDERVELRVGDAVEVDIVIQNVRDLIGFGLDFTYDPLVVHVTRVNVHMLLASEPGSNVIDFTKNFAAPEDSDGVLTPVAADLAQGAAGSSEGHGVLVRLSLQAVGCGASRLSVRPNPILGPMLQDSQGELFNPVSVEDAEILVASAGDEQCPRSATAPQTSEADQASAGTDLDGGASGVDTGVAGSSSSDGGQAEDEGGSISEDEAEEVESSEIGEGSDSKSGVGPSPSSGQDESRPEAGELASDTGSPGAPRWLLIVGVPVAAALAALAIAGRLLWLRRRR